MKKIILPALALVAILSAPTMAEEMNHHMMATNDYFATARDTMHQNMNVTPTGNVDLDFAKGMVPHHQGAIDMAKIELEHGTDPELRKLAEGIIKAQESEIKFMNEWIAKTEKK